MEIDLYEKAIKDFEYWKKSDNKIIQKKISNLFNDMKAHPFEGLGKPEQLNINWRANGRGALTPSIG